MAVRQDVRYKRKDQSILSLRHLLHSSSHQSDHHVDQTSRYWWLSAAYHIQCHLFVTDFLVDALFCVIKRNSLWPRCNNPDVHWCGIHFRGNQHCSSLARTVRTRLRCLSAECVQFASPKEHPVLFLKHLFFNILV